MISRRILYTAGLLCAAVFYFAYRKWFSWIVLLSAAILPWISLVLSLRAMLCTSVKLTAPAKITRGENCTASIRVSCPGARMPMKYSITAENAVSGKRTVIGRDKKLPCDHCGCITADMRAYVYDYLGLFSLKLKKIPQCRVWVMPEPAETEINSSYNERLTEAWKAKIGGGYSENHEIRPYRPGDSMNLIHRKLSAKTDSLMVREPLEPGCGTVLVTLDLSGTPDEIDLKAGRLLYLGTFILEKEREFSVHAMTGLGLKKFEVRSREDFERCMKELLAMPAANSGSAGNGEYPEALRYHIGGAADENEE